jgi:NADH-quinone oxidoreductase subunit N
MLLSLAGLPLTAGFMGKFYLVASGIETARWGLIMALVITSTIGLFYYLRVVGALILSPSASAANETGSFHPISAGGFLILALLSVFLVLIGVIPSAFLNLI